MSIADLKPADTPDYMIPAWLGCIQWAAGDPNVVEAFERETGCIYRAPRNGLEMMIDEATGNPERVVREFIKWVNVNVWGPLDGEPQG